MSNKIGVTRLLKNFKVPFNADEVSERVAKKQNVSPEAIKKEWDEKRERAILKGNNIHKFAENYLKNLKSNGSTPMPEIPKSGIPRLECLRLKEFCDSMYAQGWIAGCIEEEVETQYLIGRIDAVFVHHQNKRTLIVDWKSSLPFKDFQKMLAPCESLWDNKETDAALQLAIYRRMAVRMELLPANYTTETAVVVVGHKSTSLKLMPDYPNEVSQILRSITDTQSSKE